MFRPLMWPPYPRIEQLDISKPINAHKYMKVYDTHCISATCFGHSCGHPQGGALQSIYTWKYYRI